MRTRHGAAIALVIAASLLAFLSLPALWLNRQVLNNGNWTATSSELLADPVVLDQVGVYHRDPVLRARLGVYRVDQLYSNVDVTEQIRAALPPQLQPLAQPAAGGLRTL